MLLLLLFICVVEGAYNETQNKSLAWCSINMCDGSNLVLHDTNWTTFSIYLPNSNFVQVTTCNKEDECERVSGSGTGSNDGPLHAVFNSVSYINNTLRISLKWDLELWKLYVGTSSNVNCNYTCTLPSCFLGHTRSHNACIDQH